MLTKRQIESDEILDPQEIPRPASAFGLEFIGRGPEYEPHAHRKAELILTVRGLVTCDVAKGRWMVSSQCALWIPPEMSHSVRTVGEVELYCLFLDPAVAQDLPTECCTIAVSPLLRELVIAASRLPTLYDPMGPAGNLVSTDAQRARQGACRISPSANAEQCPAAEDSGYVRG